MVELVDEDAVDVQPGIGPGEVTLKTIVGRDVFGVDILGLLLTLLRQLRSNTPTKS